MKKVFVVGTARDCSATLEQDVNRVLFAFGEKCELHWLIIESDSSDNSIEILKSLKNRIPNFDYKSFSKLVNIYPERTQRLAFCRNEYLKEIKKLDSSFELIAVMDFDGINSLLSPQSIESCWKIKDWSVQTANQEGPYFDIWALRHQSWCPNDWITEYNKLKAKGMKSSKALHKSLYVKMVTIPRESDPIEVESAFGGFALYKRECFASAIYEGMSDGKPVCEHVSLHQTIRKSGGKILINPGLINAGYTSHTLILKPTIKIKTSIKAILNKRRHKI